MFRVSADDPDRADPASEAVLLTAEQPFANHNGGQILFGPDGMLYIGLGDGGCGGDPGGRGQSLTDLLGDILRVDVASGTGYTVPPDNPFVGQAGARPEVWSYGLRNPWRFSFDPATGDLYIADVGESAWEEVDVVTAADGAGRAANFGWNVTEGTPLLRATSAAITTGLTLPVLEYVARRGLLHHRRLRLPGRCHSRPAGALFLRRLLPGLGAELPVSGRPGRGAPAVAHARAPAAPSRASGRTPPASSTSERGGRGIPDRAADSRRSSAPWPRACLPTCGSAPRRGTTPGGAAWSTTGTTRAGAPRPGCWRSTPPFPSSAPSASTPASTRRPPRRCSRSYAEHLPPGFPCVSKVWNQLTVHTFSKAQDKARAGQVNPDFLNPDLFLEAVYEPYQRLLRRPYRAVRLRVPDHRPAERRDARALRRPAGRVLRRAAPRGPLRGRDPERGVPHPHVLRRASGARGGPCLQLLDPHALHRRPAGPAGRGVGTASSSPGRCSGRAARYDEAVDAFAPYDRIQDPVAAAPARTCCG